MNFLYIWRYNKIDYLEYQGKGKQIKIKNKWKTK